VCIDVICCFWTNAGGLAAWDGIGWSAGGGGIPGVVTSVYVNGTVMYVAGRFNDGGARSGNIAMLDADGVWHSMCDAGAGQEGCGVSGGEVYAMVADGRSLYVGGSFQVRLLFASLLQTVYLNMSLMCGKFVVF
jgi:hypothetical protein